MLFGFFCTETVLFPFPSLAGFYTVFFSWGIAQRINFMGNSWKFLRNIWNRNREKRSAGDKSQEKWKEMGPKEQSKLVLLLLYSIHAIDLSFLFFSHYSFLSLWSALLIPCCVVFVRRRNLPTFAAPSPFFSPVYASLPAFFLSSSSEVAASSPANCLPKHYTCVVVCVCVCLSTRSTVFFLAFWSGP